MEYDKVAQVWNTYKIRNATYRRGQNELAWFGLFVYQVRKDSGVSGKWLSRCLEKNGDNEQPGPITLLDEHEGKTRLAEYFKRHKEEGFVGVLTPGYSECIKEAKKVAVKLGFLPKPEKSKTTKVKVIKAKPKAKAKVKAKITKVKKK